MPKNGHYRGGGVEKKLDLDVFLDRHICPTGGTECRKLGMFELEFTRFLEECHVPRVGTGPTALYVIEAELVEFLSYPHFGGNSERNTLCLRAVTQGGIVDQDSGWRWNQSSNEREFGNRPFVWFRSRKDRR